MPRPCCWLLALACLAIPRAAPAADSPRFEFRDGDRVVLIGDDLIERDQRDGYLETFLTAENPGRAITFRNLGWSGDTAWGHARAGFGTPADGFARLKEHVLVLPPTVVIVGYGMAESFDGAAGLPRFVEGYNRLLDTIAPTKARLVLLSPIAHEDLGRPLPDPSKHNEDLKRYRDAIEQIAAARGARFVDLYTQSLKDYKNYVGPLTDDGIHLNGLGSWWLADIVSRGLWPRPELPTFRVEIDRGGAVLKAENFRAGKVEAKDGAIRFEATATMLPTPLPPVAYDQANQLFNPGITLRFPGLAPGRYTLRIDGRPANTTTEKMWGQGAGLLEGPDNLQAERLRRAINEKNRLYFYRWRPQNETYLFGFRKHEQGNNAREIPLFDPLVAAKEKEIAASRVPVTHTYELTREGEVAR